MSIDDVISAVREIAAEDPGHVYSPPAGSTLCSYTHEQPDGSLVPGCLFGAALHRLGVPLETLHKHESLGIVPVLLRHLGIDISYTTRIKLEAVQREQDNGEPWGEAVKELDA